MNSPGILAFPALPAHGLQHQPPLFYNQAADEAQVRAYDKTREPAKTLRILVSTLK
jgi:hypothetical protein